jgi:hypothetical protein
VTEVHYRGKSLNQGVSFVSAVRRVLGRVLATIGLTAIATTALVALQPASVSDALSGSQFDPTNIISDANFYDPNAMSEAEIQAFLQAHIGSCTNTLCLNVLRADTVSKAADNMCPGGYAGAAAEPASRIIFKVQQGCGISARVILVTLQKEQSLVTARGPSAQILQKAMGFGCPDSSVCSSLYYGIFNQIFQGSRQLKRYGLSAPDNISFHYFPVGVPSTVRFSPNDVSPTTGVACGSSTLTIQNKATAALYYYTPYQPNGPALANLRGSGDGCSTYGNRNFWVYYNDWFGPPSYPPGSPEGEVYGIATAPRSIRVTGWAVDPSLTTYSVPVAVQVASNWYATTASAVDPNGATNVPGSGQNHGYDITIPWNTPGPVTVCVTLINTGPGSNVSYTCRLVVVPEFPAPVGAIESAVVAPGAVTLTGWAVRPDALTGVVNLAANVGSNWYPLTAAQPDAVASTKVTGAGPNQGFTGMISLPPGVQNLCVWATGTSGSSVPIACTTVTIPSAPLAVGAIEATTAGTGSVTVVGWAVRPDAPTGLVNVAANIGNNWYQMTSGKPDAVAPTNVTGAGPNQGFTGMVTGSPGVKNLCIWATSTAGVNSMLGCTSVTFAAVPSPVGGIETATAAPGSVALTGWAVRPDVPAGLVNVAAQVGSNWYQMSSGSADTVAPMEVAGAGPNQGFSGTVPLAAGSQKVCVWATSTAGSGVLISCTTVVVPSVPAPVGEIETITGGVGTISVTGWAVRPDVPAGLVNVAANIGSNWYQMSSGTPDAIAPTKVTGAGPNQGFSGTITTTAGVKNVCIWATSSGGVGLQLVCATVTVR